VISIQFSDNGGLLRRQLVEAAGEYLDDLAWQTTLSLSRRLPQRLQALQPPGLRQWSQEHQEGGGDLLLTLEPIRQLMRILVALPGFEPQMLLNRVPRLLAEPGLRGMGRDLARGLAERGLVRLLRDVLVSDRNRTVQPA